MIKTAFERFVAAATIGALTAAVILLLIGPAKAGHEGAPYILFDAGLACTTLEDMKELIDTTPKNGWLMLAELRIMQGRCFGKFVHGPMGTNPVLFRVYYDKVVEQYIYEGNEDQPVTLVQVHDQLGEVGYSWQSITVTEFHRELPEATIQGNDV